MSTTTTYTITIGLESPTLTEKQAEQLVYDLAAKHFPSGHTITQSGRPLGVPRARHRRRARLS